MKFYVVLRYVNHNHLKCNLTEFFNNRGLSSLLLLQKTLAVTDDADTTTSHRESPELDSTQQNHIVFATQKKSFFIPNRGHFQINIGYIAAENSFDCSALALSSAVPVAAAEVAVVPVLAVNSEMAPPVDCNAYCAVSTSPVLSWVPLLDDVAVLHSYSSCFASSADSVRSDSLSTSSAAFVRPSPSDSVHCAHSVDSPFHSSSAVLLTPFAVIALISAAVPLSTVVVDAPLIPFAVLDVVQHVVAVAAALVVDPDAAVPLPHRQIEPAPN